MNDADASSSIQERPSPAGGASSRIPGKQLSSLDDYGIIREIGRGGTAIVYEAYHKSLRRLEDRSVSIVIEWSCGGSRANLTRAYL